jgi:hypothetical protein
MVAGVEKELELLHFRHSVGDNLNTLALAYYSALLLQKLETK